MANQFINISQIEKIKIKTVLGFILSAACIFAFRIYCYLVASKSFELKKIGEVFIKVLFSGGTWFSIIILFFIFFFIICDPKKFFNIIFKYRFLIAACIFIICVLFEITGSSIGLWCSYFGEPDKDILAGVSRPIRSDEWNVFTPLGISQYYNYSGAFPYYSNVPRGCPTDMFLEYGQAALNPLVVFRPFFWGYLFLPVAKGMAFFWCGRLIALMLVSFEFLMLVTNKKKFLSFSTAILIAFAPVVQWWFAINGLVEMLIYTQLSVLCLKGYMTQHSMAKRLVYLAVIVICAGGYVLTFYPPWMIPCAYILLALAIWIFLDNYKSCKMRIVDYFCIVASIFVFSISMAYLYYKSRDAIHTLMQTVYPGNRFNTGGGIFFQFFLHITNIWHSILGEGAVGNVCESSYFIDFFPVCWILPVITLRNTNKKDILTILLFATSVFLGIFCTFGFPKMLSKVTLLSICQPGRVIVLFGFCNILLLARTLSSENLSSLSFVKSLMAACVILLVSIQGYKSLNPHFLSRVKLYITAIIFLTLYFCLFYYSSKKASMVWKILVVLIALFSSLLANPIRHGIKSVERISVLQTLKDIHSQEPKAIWVMENEGLQNAGLLVGAPTLNSINIYPNVDRWRLIDPERKFENIYNRYAHIRIHVQEIPYPDFRLISPDLFICFLTVADLRKMGGSFLMTNRDLSEYVCSGDLTYLAENSGHIFYKVNKK